MNIRTPFSNDSDCRLQRAPTGLTMLLWGVLLCGTLAALWFAGRADSRFQLQQTLHRVSQYVGQQAAANASVVDSVSLQVAREDGEALERYARQLRTHYPRLREIWLVQRVPEASESDPILASNRYRLDFRHIVQPGLQWKADQRPSALQDTLEQAFDWQRIALSPVLLSREPAVLALVKPVFDEGRTAERFATLIIEAQNLLPGDPELLPGMRMALLWQGPEPSTLVSRHAEPRGALERLLLPQLSLTERLELEGQPLAVRIDYQPGWSSLPLGWLSLVLGMALVSLLGMLRIAKNWRQSQAKNLQREVQLQVLANYDAITGLPNRNLLKRRMAEAQRRALQDDLMVALLFIDLDDFKRINDRYGHQQGDDLLKRVGARLAENLRATDTVARYASDEFIVVLSNMRCQADVEQVHAKLIKALRQPFQVAGQDIVLNASIGCALSPQDGVDCDRLLSCADAAMYRCKDQPDSASVT